MDLHPGQDVPKTCEMERKMMLFAHASIEIALLDKCRRNLKVDLAAHSYFDIFSIIFESNAPFVCIANCRQVPLKGIANGLFGEGCAGALGEESTQSLLAWQSHSTQRCAKKGGVDLSKGWVARDIFPGRLKY